MDTLLDKPITVWAQYAQYKTQVLVRFLYQSRIAVVQTGIFEGQLLMPNRALESSKRHEEEFADLNADPRSTLLYFPYRDMYWLYRGIIHGKDGYRRDRHGEFFRLQSAIASARELHSELLSIKKGDELIAREGVLRSLIYSVLLYATPWSQSQLKQEVFEKTTDVSKLRDSRGRKNPTPLAAKTVSLLNRLNSREDVIASVESIFVLRKSILTHCLSALDFEVNISADYFGLLKTRWEDVVASNELIFSAKMRLTGSMMLFRSIDISPYRVTFTYSGDECSQIIASLESQKFNDGYPVVCRTLTGFLLRQLRSDLELLMLDLSRWAHFKDVSLDGPKMIGEIQAVQTRLMALDTNILTDFNVDVVQTFLEETKGYLGSREIQNAHQAFQQALVLL